jgi:hypothetical protein
MFYASQFSKSYETIKLKKHCEYNEQKIYIERVLFIKTCLHYGKNRSKLGLFKNAQKYLCFFKRTCLE